MTFDTIISTAALMLLIVLAWGGVVRGVSVASASKINRPNEHQEFWLLILMIVPAFIGLAIVFMGNAAPIPLLSPPRFGAVTPQEVVNAMQNTAEGVTRFNWIELATQIVVGVYVAGVAGLLTKLISQIIRLRQITTRAVECELGADVTITPEVVPPFASVSGRVVLPKSLLTSLTASQLSFIIDHERAHIKRGDTKTFLLLSLIDAIFWFSPFIRRQTQRCRLAAEIACDAAVTETVPHLKVDYAKTLLTVLKVSAGAPPACAPSVFSRLHKSEYETRLRQLTDRVVIASTRRQAWLVASVALLIAPLTVFQIAVAQSTTMQMPEFSILPVNGTLASRFRETIVPAEKAPPFDRGIFLNASPGAAIVAAADGRVMLVMPHPDGIGEFVMMDHGGGYVACYGPVKSINVVAGDKLEAGQSFAQFDANAIPYLYFEIIKEGQAVNPITALNL